MPSLASRSKTARGHQRAGWSPAVTWQCRGGGGREGSVCWGGLGKSKGLQPKCCTGREENCSAGGGVT